MRVRSTGAAKGIRITRAGHRHRLADAIGAHLEGEEVEDADADDHLQPRRLGLDARDDLAEEPRPVFEAAAIAARTIDGREELVPEIAVAVLDIHEGIAGLLACLAARTKSPISRAISSSVNSGASPDRPNLRSRQG